MGIGKYGYAVLREVIDSRKPVTRKNYPNMGSLRLSCRSTLVRKAREYVRTTNLLRQVVPEIIKSAHDYIKYFTVWEVQNKSGPADNRFLELERAAFDSYVRLTEDQQFVDRLKRHGVTIPNHEDLIYGAEGRITVDPAYSYWGSLLDEFEGQKERIKSELKSRKKRKLKGGKK